MVHPGRFSAALEGDFVVFLIGARVNRWYKPASMFWVGRAMTAMQKELTEQAELGCLHIENWSGRTSISVQYWRSFEALEAYARSREAEHLPAWRKFNKLIKDNGDIGVWHETFKVRDGEYEGFYGNMPRFGLADAGQHTRLGLKSTAALRSGTRQGDLAPVEAY